jgi:hypothetical protein
MPDEDLGVKDEAAEESPPSADVKDKEKDSSSESDAKTLADVVRETAEASKGKDSSSEQVVEEDSKDEAEPSSEETSESGKTKEEEKKPAEVAKEEDKKLPFHTHPRFQELTKERSAFKAEVESLKPAAQRAKAIDDYCQKYGISGDEFNSAVEIAALLHVDPAKALTTLRSYVEILELTLGNKLPADLQKEVDEGAISEARAKELASLRVKSQGLEYTGKKSEQQVAQERQAAITSAINSWDSQKRTSDIAYEKKYPLVEKAFIALCSMNPPRSPQEAIQLAEKAYSEVNTALGTFVPKPPVRKVLKTNGSAGKSGLDAIKPGTSLREALPQIARHVISSHKE